jgi:hypothetical protein
MLQKSGRDLTFAGLLPQTTEEAFSGGAAGPQLSTLKTQLCFFGGAAEPQLSYLKSQLEIGRGAPLNIKETGVV